VQTTALGEKVQRTVDMVSIKKEDLYDILLFHRQY
jgi:hypothetical protein